MPAQPMRLFGRPVWPDRLTLWRWHRTAGLFCLPFVAFLCITGSIYLFRPQIDRWIDRPFDHLPGAVSATPDAAVRAALAAVPDGALLALELPRGSGHATRVIVDQHGEAIRVYVDPSTLAVLKRVPEEWRFERIVSRLHGQLLLGNAGSVITEMVASWTIVLVLTGLVLWWPRGGNRAAGVAYPRLRARVRTRWRDLHAVTGAWVSLLLVLFLVSGLPWSFVWGNALARVEQLAARLQTVPDWEIGAAPVQAGLTGRPAAAPAGGSMAGMDMGPVHAADADALRGLDAVVATAQRLRFPAPVMIVPPLPGETDWRVRSDTQDRPQRIEASVAPDGTVSASHGFAGKPLLDRVVGFGVAAHEGQLFGWPNQLLNLAAASALALMSVAATVLWLRRKPPGGLGLPAAAADRRIGIGSVALMVVLGVLLPELGAALLLLVLAARIGRRTGPRASG